MYMLEGTWIAVYEKWPRSANIASEPAHISIHILRSSHSFLFLLLLYIIIILLIGLCRKYFKVNG